MKTSNHSLTLIELLIALILTAVVTLAFVNIDLFSRYHMLTAERRSTVQNEASRALNGIGKEVLKAIGNEKINGADSVVRIDITGSSKQISFYIDGSKDGVWQAPVNGPGTNAIDHWLSFRWDSLGANQYELRYCERCKDVSGNCQFNQCEVPEYIVSARVTDFSCSVLRNGSDSTLASSYAEFLIAARDVPGASVSFENPEVTMLSRFEMPSVSLR